MQIELFNIRKVQPAHIADLLAHAAAGGGGDWYRVRCTRRERS